MKDPMEEAFDEWCDPDCMVIVESGEPCRACRLKHLREYLTARDARAREERESTRALVTAIQEAGVNLNGALDLGKMDRHAYDSVSMAVNDLLDAASAALRSRPEDPR